MSLIVRLWRFALVGIICFLVQWCLVHLLRHTIHPFIADVIGFALSAQLNFWLCRSFTWHDKAHEQDSSGIVTWGRYNVVALVATAVNAFAFWQLSRFGEVSALVLAAVPSSLCSFALNHHYVFKGKKMHLLLPEQFSVDLQEAAKDGIAIFLPAYNEAANLPYTVSGAVSFLHEIGVPFRVIVIDDGSSDDTPRVTADLQLLYSEVQTVRHEVNQGYGAALRTGLKAALETGYDWIGFCDSDGQFHPRDFRKLIEHAVHFDADICIGYRIDRADGLKRRLMGRGWHIITRLILGYDAIDVDCGFKLFRKHAVMALEPQLRGENATISPEMLRRAKDQGHRTVEVGVNHYPRQHGTQTGANLGVIIGSFKGLWDVRRMLNHEHHQAKSRLGKAA